MGVPGITHALVMFKANSLHTVPFNKIETHQWRFIKLRLHDFFFTDIVFPYFNKFDIKEPLNKNEQLCKWSEIRNIRQNNARLKVLKEK